VKGHLEKHVGLDPGSYGAPMADLYDPEGEIRLGSGIEAVVRQGCRLHGCGRPRADGESHSLIIA
jgi:hypothetical protein